MAQPFIWLKLESILFLSVLFFPTINLIRLNRSDCKARGGGALPYVVGYQVPVNRPPFFTPILHPMTPFFYSVHTQWPPFFHFCIKFYIKIANFWARRAHFEKFNDFVAILKENLQILPWNCIFPHGMTPILGSPHQKSPRFFGTHTEWPPFFDEILHWMPPIFVLR